MHPLLKLLRPRQWIKNAFVAAPLFFGLELFFADSAARIGIAVVIFCLLSSAVYIFNDLRDVENDKKHPKKSKRPLASGAVTPVQAMILGAALMVATIILALMVPFAKEFYLCLAGYAGLSLAYSLGLKRINLAEIFVVASGYVLRILAGCAAIGVIASPWILSATGVLALLMVAGKRRSEIGVSKVPPATHYTIPFLDNVIGMLGAATIVTYLLFTTSDYAIERYGEYVIATSIFVVYGVLRYIQLVQEGKADDPTTIVTKDNGIRICLALWALAFFALIYWH